MKIGIFYGSATGQTGSVAEELAKALNVDAADVHDVAASRPDQMGQYDVLLLGTSTWGQGDLEDDWYDFIAGAEELDLRGKKMAFFGVGDETMADTFCSAMGELYRRMHGTGAETIGLAFPSAPYTYTHTDAVTDDGLTVGLMLDNTNHADLTPGRVAKWAEQLKTEM